MKINTEIFKEALSFLSMGISSNTSKYETLLVEFETSNGKFKGFTFDGINKLAIRIFDTNEPFNCTLKFSDIYNIVKACKDEEMELNAFKNYAQIKTKTVSCKLSVFDHKINRAQLTQYTNTENGQKIANYLTVLKSILNTNHVEECYRYIYFKDKIMVTNTDDAIIINEKLFNNILLPLKSVEILSTFGDFNYAIENNTLFVLSDNKIVELRIMDATKYQYDDICDLFIPLKNKITITKDTLSNAINLASIFNVENINLVFNVNGANLEIPSIDFVYKLSATPCIDMTYTLPLSKLKKFLTIGENLTIGFDSTAFVNVEDDIKAIFGIKSEDES